MGQHHEEDDQVLWRPDPYDAADSELGHLLARRGLTVEDYAALHTWSIDHPGEFWQEVWDTTSIIGDQGRTPFVPSDSAPMTGSAFFPEARLNFAENLLRGDQDSVAVIETGESGGTRTVTVGQLRNLVGRFADGLRSAGVKPGDRVSAILPNRVECLVSLIASASIGAVWTSCSPDFGPEAIVSRLGQVEPTVLVAQTTYVYGGREHDINDTIASVVEELPSLSVVVAVGESKPAVRAVPFDEFGEEHDVEYVPLPFDHPLYVLYTSGTTGTPKAIVHGAGGTLLQQTKEHVLHGDVRSGDRILWYTNTAWMMYHWLVAALAAEASIVLYDGAPVLKTDNGLDCSALWRAAEDAEVTHLGVSPKYLATLADESYVPFASHDLSSLRWLMSAGAPVAPAQFDWVYEAVGDVGFASISGGTEIMGCFFLGSPIHPVRRGELTVKGLGMGADVLGPDDEPVTDSPGELVCTQPFPSMPLRFWGEGGLGRYHATYFGQRPGVWTHGDYAEIRSSGGAVIYGRSDATLNPGGVRIGTADIYNTCASFPELEDFVAFGRPTNGDEEVVLCIKLRDATVDIEALARDIRSALRRNASPRHVPAAIYVVGDIPYTTNGKRVEGAARSAATGLAVANQSNLANPHSLADFQRLEEGHRL